MSPRHRIAGSEVGRARPPAYPTAYPARSGALTRWLAFIRLT